MGVPTPIPVHAHRWANRSWERYLCVAWSRLEDAPALELDSRRESLSPVQSGMDLSTDALYERSLSDATTSIAPRSAS